MGLPSHSLVVMLLKKQRPLKLKHTDFFNHGCKHTTKESLYFQALVQYAQCKLPSEKIFQEKILKELHPQNNFKITEIEDYKITADWVHTYLIALTEIPCASWNIEDLTTQIGRGVTQERIKSCLNRLIEKNILIYKNGVYSSSSGRITTKNDLINKAAQNYHKEITKIAIESLEQAPANREFQSLSLAIDPTKITRAKEMIRDFRNRFTQEIQGGSHSTIYQLNLQFFELPKNKVKKTQLKERKQSCSKLSPLL
tara:strand:+ start:279 stop:1043 length:765 start_codon:yes stop_codon:yes gene_type:complete